MKRAIQKYSTCRLCLKVDTTVCKIGDTQLKGFIESLFKLNELHTFQVPSENHHICYMCVALLRKTSNFILMICNAQKLIYDTITKNTNLVTKDLLKNIDRQKNGLHFFELSSVCMFESIEPIHDNNLGDNTPIEKEEEILCIELSDEEINEPIIDACDLDGGEIAISDPLAVNNNIRNKFEINSKDCNFTASQSNGPKLIEKKTKRYTEKYEDYCSESERSSESESKTKRNKEETDYEPDSTSHSEDTEYDSYDDEGRRIKRPKIEDRIYPRKCDHCDYIIQKKFEHYHHYLREHPKIDYPYANEKTHACSICGKLMPKDRVKFHEKSHIVTKVKCPACPKAFNNRIKMLKHKISVHPKINFVCDYCSKIFKTRSDLGRHIRIHTGEKPYTCHICGAGFAHSGNRIIHIRSAHQNCKYVPKKKRKQLKIKQSYNSDENNSDAVIKLDAKQMSRSRKRNKNKSKKIVDYSAEVLESEHGKHNITETRVEGDINCSNTGEDKKRDANTDSDDENLAMIKRKKECQNATKVKKTNETVREIESEG